MPNPALLLCDSDALVQFFLANDLRPLQALKADFEIQPTIVLEVDMELRRVGKHKDRFVPQLEKALKHGTLAKLDQALFQTYLATATPGTSWSTYQALGMQYYGYVQRGEAYTHAAAVTLGMPAMSNDFRAVRLLEEKMLTVAAPTLRSFDLLVFAYQSDIQLSACEDIRSSLLEHGEGIPGPFRNRSFADGVSNFPCRLQSGTNADDPAARSNTHYEPLTIKRR
jgi:hypothetical protein